MRFIVNENVFEPIIQFLKDEGHQVLSVREAGLSGATDDTIYAIAIQDNLIIITMDKDFTRMLRFPPEKCGGIIVIKLYRMTVDKTTDLFKQYFRKIDESKIRNRLTIMTRDGIRFRGKGSKHNQ